MQRFWGEPPSSRKRRRSSPGRFAGPNNLKNITIDTRYSALCGDTEQDVETVFAPEGLNLYRERIRDWYNGSNGTVEAIYGPFDLLLPFDAYEFRASWFETGTPTFPVDLLTEQGFFSPRLARLRADEALLSAFDVDYLSPEALLRQSSYLTVTGTRRIGARLEYPLGYPNPELGTARNDRLAKALIGRPGQASELASRLYDVLLSDDFGALRAHAEALFAARPLQWHDGNTRSPDTKTSMPVSSTATLLFCGCI